MPRFEDLSLNTIKLVRYNYQQEFNVKNPLKYIDTILI